MKRTKLIVLGALIAMSLATGAATAADGKAVWDKYCAGCHASLKKAPKFGNKTTWAPLIKRGVDDLTAVVVKGIEKSWMPPLGGAATEADVRAAVEYVISQMQSEIDP
jgi:cytochrome c5